jgi:hypothetical protein
MDAVGKILVRTERELDVLVAEHVMGWTFFESKHGYWQGNPPDGDYCTSFAAQFDPVYGNLIKPTKEDINGLPRFSNSYLDEYESFNSMF